MLALSEMPLPCRLAWLDDQQDFSPQLTLQLRGAALEYVRYGVPEQRAQRAHRSLSRVRDLGAPQDMLDRLGGALAGTPQQVQDSMQRLTQSLQPGDRDTLLSALRSLGAQTMSEFVFDRLRGFGWVWCC
jgi:hypothetical protein